MKYIEKLREANLTKLILHHCCLCGYPVTADISGDPAILDEGCYCVLSYAANQGKTIREVPLKTIEESIEADPSWLMDLAKGGPQ